MTRLLLVSPSFHGYWQAIAAALTARGHVVTTSLYDARPSAVAKAQHKLRTELPTRLGRAQGRSQDDRATRLAIAAAREVRPDVVVVVKGDVLGDDFYSEIGSARRTLWLYDELRRTEWATRDISVAGPVCSYSPSDTEELVSRGVAARHLPLAFDHRLGHPADHRRGNDVVFIGARYPSREHTLLELQSRGVRVHAYGRDWSHRTWDRVRTWDLRRPDLAAGEELDRSQAYSAMASGLATLNIHGDQDGFTMRTFEACGVGALQLIDRADVSRYYDDGTELASYSSLDELVHLCRRAAGDPQWASRVRAAGARRTLAEHTFDHRVQVLEDSWA